MGYRRRVMLLPYFLACLLMVQACAKGLVLSGELLDATGKQFVTTGKLYNDLQKSKLISDAEYRKWAAFAREFKSGYPVAVSAWQAVKESNDNDAKSLLYDKIVALKDVLVEHYIFALEKVGVR